VVLGSGRPGAPDARAVLGAVAEEARVVAHEEVRLQALDDVEGDADQVSRPVPPRNWLTYGGTPKASETSVGMIAMTQRKPAPT